MATYLPVLVSVNTNAVPDDSSLSTLPRAQVDYLSHNWQEEDVWRSWRSMTRQKNEIANGVRLENASWRTWWKQRNKLKTVSPETLNWLKDSDVTWLYGPLHTAVDWRPPPRTQQTDNSSLSTDPRPQKPILKHRSISQLLTSDLPPSATSILSPEGSDEDKIDRFPQTQLKRPILPHTKSDTNITRWGPGRAYRKESPPRIVPPGLANHAPLPASRRSSPPAPSSIRPSLSQDSASSAGGSSGTGSDKPKKKHISFNTFVEQCIAIEKPKKNASGLFVREDVSWYTRTPSIDEAGYEEDEEDDEEEEEPPYNMPWDQRRTQPPCVVRSDSDEENDEEDDGIIEMRPSSHRNTPKKKPVPRSQSQVSTTSSSSSASTSTTSSHSSTSIDTNSTSSPGSSLSPSRKNLQRKPSSASSSVSTTTMRPPIHRRHSHTSSRRPPPLYRRASEHVHVTIAPIAPTILKTGGGWSEGFGDECPSDDGLTGWLSSIAGPSPHNPSSLRSKSGETGAFGTSRSWKSDEEAQGSSDGTPVELVYVPPFGSRYSLGTGEYEEHEYLEEDEDMVVDHLPPATVVSSSAIQSPSASIHASVPAASFAPSSPAVSASAPIPIASSRSSTTDASVPTVVLDSSSGHTHSNKRQRPDVREDDPYDFFSGPDMGEDYYARRGGRGYERGSGYGGSYGTYTVGGNSRERERARERQQVTGRERESRSRSRSQSRTPSPAMTGVVSPPAAAAASVTASATATFPPAPAPVVEEEERGRRRASASSSTSPSSGHLTRGNSSDLLSPPPSSSRGRALGAQEASSSGSSSSPSGYARPQPSIQIQTQSRGRSSARGSSTSSSWDRSVSVGSSPMGSLSPDGSGAIGSVGSVLAGGRSPRDKELYRDRERKAVDSDRGRGRDQERRGRDRNSGRSSIVSSSSTGDLGTVASPTEMGSVTSSTGASDRIPIGKQASVSSTTSTSSSTSTGTVTPAPAHNVNLEMEYIRRAEEELRRKSVPTPASSPTIQMQRPDPPSAPISLPPPIRADGNGATLEQLEESDTSSGILTPSMDGDSSGGTTTPTMTSVSSISGATPSMTNSMSSSTSTVIPTPPPPTSMVSPTKLAMRPPLAPTPPSPAKPSTSFMAVSSPVKPTQPSNPSPGPSSISATAHSPGRKGPTSPSTGNTLRSESEERRSGGGLVGKAVDMVNSAGIYLGLWQYGLMGEGKNDTGNESSSASS